MLKEIFWKKSIFRTRETKWKNSNCYFKKRYFKFCNILHSKRNKEIGKKRKMSYKIYKRYTIIGLQGFDNYENLNQIEVSLDSNSLTNGLFKYKKCKCWFIIKNLLLSSRIKSNTQVTFLSCDRLKDAKEAFVNWKLYKTLGRGVARNFLEGGSVFENIDYHGWLTKKFWIAEPLKQ